MVIDSVCDYDPYTYHSFSLCRARARQVIQLGIALYEFVQEHTIPVSCAMVLGGDLNCFDMKRLITVGRDSRQVVIRA